MKILAMIITASALLTGCGVNATHNEQADRFGNGTHHVGREIAPGTYQPTFKHAATTGCLWTIRSSDGKVSRTGLAKKSRPHFTITLHTEESATSTGNCIWVRTDT